MLGCMAQKDKDLVFRKMPHVDLVVGTGQLAEVPDLIDTAREKSLRGTKSRLTALSLSRKGGTRTQIEGSFESYDPLREPTMRPTPHQAFVRVMIGCDKFCSYCVVPSTRGPEQSRSPADILKETQVLADQGVKEITLLGQTVNSYKHTENGKPYRLADLLYLIHDTPGIERIKFVTGYPRDLGDDLLTAIRDLRKCYHYLHVPLQSGCDDVLKVMKRGYTVAHYRDMMHRVWETVPGCSVSSDFIVGHPGETEESFRKSVESVREFRFKNSFIFKYSPRPGTKGFERLPDDVPDAVKKRRNNELLAVQNEVSEEENARHDRADGVRAGRGAERETAKGRRPRRRRPGGERGGAVAGADAVRPDRGVRREPAADRHDGGDRRGGLHRHDAVGFDRDPRADAPRRPAGVELAPSEPRPSGSRPGSPASPGRRLPDGRGSEGGVR